MANITTDNINTIAQLAASINDGDYILIYKAGAQTFSKIEKSVFIQAFGAGGINVDDIVNNCTDGGVDKALSAEMGKALKDNLTIVQSNVQLLLDTLANLAFINVPKPTLTPIDWNATPYISVSPSSLSFSAVAGGTSSATFTVNGSNLTGSLSVAVSGSNASLFAVNKSTITANEAANGATVTVTYQPGARGTHSATITISGGGASQKTVSLNGTATSQDVTTYNVIPNLMHLNMQPNGGTVESGGTFSGVLSVEDSALYDLPTSIQASGTHGTVSYNSDTGAFSIQNITSNVIVSAFAENKEQEEPTTLKVVRGWVLSEDKAVMSSKISAGTAASGETFKWIFPRKMFASNGTTQLNGSGGNANSSYLLPVTNICYTGFVKIPATSASYLLYVHGIRKPYMGSSVTAAMFPSLVFYKLENGAYVPIYAKGTQTLDTNHCGEIRLFNINDSAFSEVKTAITNGVAYVRMTFEMSDADTIVAGKNIEKRAQDPSGAPSTITCGLYACNSTGGDLASIWNASDGYTVVDNPFRYDKDDLLTEQDTGTYTD